MKSRYVLAALLLLTACTEKTKTHHGGQDGGGGHVRFSSTDEVNSALDRALELAFETDITQNVFYAYLAEKERGSDQALYQRACNVIAGSGSETCKIDLAKQDRTHGRYAPYFIALNSRRAAYQAEQHFAHLLGKSKINRVKADCGSAKDDHADASVPAFHEGVDICVSVGNLRKVTPVDLLREVLSLLLHESAHLSGMDESEAQAIQADFADYYNYRFGSIDSRRLADNAATILMTVEVNLQHADVGSLTSTERLLLFHDVELAIEQMPLWLDPLALRIAEAPRYPKSTLAYSYAVMNYILMIKPYLQRTEPPSAIEMEDLISTCEQFEGRIHDAWESLVKNAPDYTCGERPTGILDRVALSFNTLENQFNFGAYLDLNAPSQYPDCK